ncbi:MAG: hypothetical protein EOO06_11785 [Chitinophagaceae bacterium]|nr:MAG: hypothetical protein EOO06_11785 [Chitinophagaceae bacterium]
MSKITKNIIAITILVLGTTAVTNAQVTSQKIGTNPTVKDPSAVLEVEHASKGILFPRVLLSSTTVAAPVTAPANGLTVFNTATAGDVTPGYYYWSTAATRWVRMSSSLDYQEPFQVATTTNKATLNTQSIYQNGNIGIDPSVANIFSTTSPIAPLDVRGAVRGGTGHLGTVGTNSVAFGEGHTVTTANSGIFGGWTSSIIASVHSGILAGADNSINGSYSGNSVIVGGNSNRVIGTGPGTGVGNGVIVGGTSNILLDGAATILGGNRNTIAEGGRAGFIAGGVENIVSGQGSSILNGTENTASGWFAVVSGVHNTSASQSEFVAGQYNAITTATPNAFLANDPLFQVGNGNFTTSNNALTILKSGKTAIGLVGTEAAAKPTELLDLGGAATAGNGGLKIRNINSAAYTGTSADKIVVADATGVLKTVASVTATPKFFYAPSVVLPTVNASLPSHITYDAGTETFTVNLYSIYSNQYGMTGDVAGATRTAIKSPTATTLPVTAVAALEYFVTYFDNTVFDPNSITLSDAGVLTYKILPAGVVSEKTYMNIVFKVK